MKLHFYGMIFKSAMMDVNCGINKVVAVWGSRLKEKMGESCQESLLQMNQMPNFNLYLELYANNCTCIELTTGEWRQTF